MVPSGDAHKGISDSNINSIKQAGEIQTKKNKVTLKSLNLDVCI